MSAERVQDLLLPPARKLEAELERERDVLPLEVLEDEQRLLQTIRRLAKDDVALCAFLSLLPHDRQLAAQLALVRELGGQRARAVSERAFGDHARLLPRHHALSTPPARSNVRSLEEYAASRRLAQALTATMGERDWSPQTLVARLAEAAPAIAQGALSYLKRMPFGGARSTAFEVLDVVTGGAASSAAQSLDPGTASRLGREFSPETLAGARIHTGRVAHSLTARHRARALTIGRDIYFADGQYRPGSRAGETLIAHEIAHVDQARRGELARPAAKGEQHDEESQVEREADERAKKALAKRKTQPEENDQRRGLDKLDKEEQAAASPKPIPVGHSVSEPVGHPEPANANPNANANANANESATANANEPAAAVPSAVAQARSPDQVYVAALSLPPSQMPEGWGATGASAQSTVALELAADQAAMPTLAISLGDQVETKDKPLVTTQPEQSTVAAPPAPLVAATPAPTVAPPPPSVVNKNAVGNLSTTVGGDRKKLEQAAPKAISDLSTDVPAMREFQNRPRQQLVGAADPSRMSAVETQGTAELQLKERAAREKIQKGRGPEAIVAPAFKHEVKPELAADETPMPELPVIAPMMQLAEWKAPLGDQALNLFDADNKPKMDASLAPVRAQVDSAKQTRDLERDKAVMEAQTDVGKLNVETQLKQKTELDTQRKTITTEREKVLAEQKAEVQKASGAISAKRQEALGEIDARAKSDDARIKTEFDAAQAEANKEQQSAKAEAEKKKKEAEEKAADKSWWESAVDFVCDTVSAVADAIDKAITAVCDLVCKILEKAKQAATAIIEAGRKFVSAAIEAVGSFAKAYINTVLGSVFPALAARINKVIDAAVVSAKKVVDSIASVATKGVAWLADRLRDRVKFVAGVFASVCKAASGLAQAVAKGDWSAIGRAVLDPILKALGIDPEQFYGMFAKAGNFIGALISDPMKVGGNMINGLVGGFKAFGSNFVSHFKVGAVQWMTGQFPFFMMNDFSAAAIFGLICQILELTYQAIRARAVAIVGEKNTKRVEWVLKKLDTLLHKGFAGLWDEIVSQLSNLWETVFEGIKNWMMQSVVMAAIMKLATMWNPVGAIIQTVKMIWDLWLFVTTQGKRIYELVVAVVESMDAIAQGNVGKAVEWIEKSLARLIPVSIGLLASLIGLGGIAGKVREIIKNVRGRVNQGIDWVIHKFAKLVGKDLGSDFVHGEAAKDVGDRIEFATAGGYAGATWFAVKYDIATPMVGPQNRAVKDHVKETEPKIAQLDGEHQGAAKSAHASVAAAEKALAADATKVARMRGEPPKDKKGNPDKAAEDKKKSAEAKLRDDQQKFAGDLKTLHEKLGADSKTEHEKPPVIGAGASAAAAIPFAMVGEPHKLVEVRGSKGELLDIEMHSVPGSLFSKIKAHLGFTDKKTDPDERAALEKIESKAKQAMKGKGDVAAVSKEISAFGEKFGERDIGAAPQAKGNVPEPWATLPDGTKVAPSHWGGGYHGCQYSPDVVFSSGLPAKGNDRDIVRHSESKSGGNTWFRGTTSVPADPANGAAANWAGEGGWVYEVRNVPTWDVNSLLEGRVKAADGSFRGNLMSGENEGAIPAHVPADRIIRVGVVSTNGMGVEYVRKDDWKAGPGDGKATGALTPFEFAMDGTTHKLVKKPEGIEMHSVPMPLSQKRAKELERISKMTPAPTERIADLKKIGELAQKAEKVWAEGSARDLAKAISVYGTKYKENDLGEPADKTNAAPIDADGQWTVKAHEHTYKLSHAGEVTTWKLSSAGLDVQPLAVYLERFNKIAKDELKDDRQKNALFALATVAQLAKETKNLDNVGDKMKAQLETALAEIAFAQPAATVGPVQMTLAGGWIAKIAPGQKELTLGAPDHPMSWWIDELKKQLDRAATVKPSPGIDLVKANQVFGTINGVKAAVERDSSTAVKDPASWKVMSKHITALAYMVKDLDEVLTKAKGYGFAECGKFKGAEEAKASAGGIIAEHVYDAEDAGTTYTFQVRGGDKVAPTVLLKTKAGVVWKLDAVALKLESYMTEITAKKASAASSCKSGLQTIKRESKTFEGALPGTVKDKDELKRDLQMFAVDVGGAIEYFDKIGFGLTKFESDSPDIVQKFQLGGADHTLFVSAGKVEMASVRDLLSKKVGRQIAQLKKVDPEPAEEIAGLIEIARLDKKAAKTEELLERQTVAYEIAEAIKTFGGKFPKYKDIGETVKRAGEDLSGTTLVSRVVRLHPSQMEFGRSNIGRMLNDLRNSATAEQKTFAEFVHTTLRAKSAGSTVPGVLDPNGDIMILDGHHRMFLYDRIEKEHVPDAALEVKVKVIFDYRGWEKAEFQRHFTDILGKGQFKADLREVDNRVDQIPKSLSELDNNTLRATVGAAMFKAMKECEKTQGPERAKKLYDSVNLIDYIEFKLAQKLVHDGFINELKEKGVLTEKDQGLPKNRATDKRVVQAAVDRFLSQPFVDFLERNQRAETASSLKFEMGGKPHTLVATDKGIEMHSVPELLSTKLAQERKILAKSGDTARLDQLRAIEGVLQRVDTMKQKAGAAYEAEVTQLTAMVASYGARYHLDDIGEVAEADGEGARRAHFALKKNTYQLSVERGVVMVHPAPEALGPKLKRALDFQRQSDPSKEQLLADLEAVMSLVAKAEAAPTANVDAMLISIAGKLTRFGDTHGWPDLDPQDVGWGAQKVPKTIQDGDPLLVETISINTPGRLKLRDRIVEEVLSKHHPLPVDGRAPLLFMMGGGTASGKGTVAKELIRKGQLPSEGALHLDPDEIKERIPEYKMIIARGDGRAALIVHEESSMLSKRILAEAYSRKYDIVMDVTLGNSNKGLKSIQHAKEMGYEVRLVGVTTDVETSVERSTLRAKETGRYVPREELLKSHRGFSQGFEGYASLCEEVMLYDNNDGPKLIYHKQKEKLLQIEEQYYERFLEKQWLNVDASTVAELKKENVPVVPATPPTRAEYVQAAMENLHRTSRTAGGTVDTSASANKKDQMAEGLTGDQAAKLAQDNVRTTIGDLHDDKSREFTSPEDVRRFVEDKAKFINGGITKAEALIRKDDSEKYPYTKVADLESAMQQFYREFHERLQNPDENPHKLAAWVEYRIDLTDHFFADGCGKISKAISAWVLMRKSANLPQYPQDRKELFSAAPSQRRTTNSAVDRVQFEQWFSFYKKLFKKV